jgi:two-component system sensor histidine kinase HydH
MPVFIDGHKMGELNALQLKKILNNSADKHGVTHKDILYNEKQNKLFCILEAPNKESIVNHHEDVGIDCDFIFEVTSLRNESVNRAERLSTMGELSARVAHDLRNPLGIIKNAVELIEISSEEITDEKLKKRISMIKNAADRMLRQINNVLDFVRTRPLQLEKKSLSIILELSFKSSVPETIKITKPENDLSIICDSKQLETVFSNILINAVQAMGNSGEIKVRIKEKENDVNIEIEDSGPGIPEDKIEQIFDPLFTTKSSGTGLGLVSCKNIIEEHKGTISVKNNPTIFEIILPKKVSKP